MSSKSLKTEASIIKIIDEYQVLINKGSESDIQKGDTVEIFSVGEAIYDPIEKVPLGTLDIIKEELLVTIVYPQMAICEREKKVVRMNFGHQRFTADFAGDTYLDKQKIKINPEDISGGFEKTDTTVKIGDPVRIYTTA